ncbi:MAG TPA: helix-turn-helix domain-containing protein [Solirubrobacteraceae bacterium]|jgi:excisionase family DNA binding protein|nr:helix-turn-helix domain-containing protein [Solirubrobacteraceae bacterium]
MPQPSSNTQNPATTPLFVRIPADAAARLDRTAFERGTSKRELVTDAVVRLLDGEVTVGRAEVHGPPEPAASTDREVLTVEQAAVLLQVDTETVRALARDGELPARKVGREWRFSRAALLRWVAGE